MITDSDTCVDQVLFEMDSQFDIYRARFEHNFIQQVKSADPEFFNQHKNRILDGLIAEVECSFKIQGKALFESLHRAFSNMLYGHNMEAKVDQKSEFQKMQASNTTKSDSKHQSSTIFAQNSTTSSKPAAVLGTTGFGAPAPQVTPSALQLQNARVQHTTPGYSLSGASFQMNSECTNYSDGWSTNPLQEPGEQESKSLSAKVIYPDDEDSKRHSRSNPSDGSKGLAVCVSSESKGAKQLDWYDEQLLQAKSGKQHSEDIGQANTVDIPYTLQIVKPTTPGITELRESMSLFLQKLLPSAAENIGPYCLVRDQRSIEWFEQRGFRLTSSNFGKMFKRKTLDPPEMLEKLVHGMLNRKKYSGKIPALEYGCENEARARMEYEKRTGNAVEETGFWTRSDCAFLGGSPDGIVTDKKTGEEGLLEIKCPYSGRAMGLKEYSQTPSSVLESDGRGGYYLNPSHEYNYQMQGCMYILKKKWCDFVVMTEAEIHVERIYKNETIINKMVAKLKEMYIRFFLPSLATGSHKQAHILYTLLSSEMYSKHFANLIKTPAA
jgi:YqaJ-like viral recombinase domain